jgi:hypothetical protein
VCMLIMATRFGYSPLLFIVAISLWTSVDQAISRA